MAAGPLLALVGETASGKSALALELAKQFNGELICADSRTVYKGMDIGTAKPSREDQRAVPHHLLDIVTPDESFNVREFKKLALEVIEDIAARGKLPILVGGTGLYVDAILFDYDFSPPGARRDLRNPRHLKYQELTAYSRGLRQNSLVIGLAKPKDQLAERIATRTNVMFQDGLANEVGDLIKQYGWEVPGLNTIGYKEFQSYFKNEQTLEEVHQQIEHDTILFAKRQRTWFKRNKHIVWLDDPSRAVDLVTTFLNT